MTFPDQFPNTKRYKQSIYLLTGNSKRPYQRFEPMTTKVTSCVYVSFNPAHIYNYIS